MMDKCRICSVDFARYKCSKCRILYCSMKCYKNHNEQGCEKILVPNSSPKECESYTYVTEDTIPAEKLKLLASSDELRNILNNPHVRDILHEIDSSAKASETMEKAMKEPIFLEFADVCLKLIDDKDTEF